MADVRSMLRNELASRRSSTESGSAGTRITKKRKIDGDDLSIQSIRKKSRPTTPAPTNTLETDDTDQQESITPNHESEAFVEETDAAQGEAQEDGPPGTKIEQHESNSLDAQKSQVTSSTAQIAASDQTLDEDEWSAFEREVVAPTRVTHVPAAAIASATISAAPVTADELAVQQQRQKEEQARAQEEDGEAEKEDAARHLEEEFEEMEQLEQRVKRLKAKREELRTQNSADSNGSAIEVEEAAQQGGDGSEDDEDDTDWDDWRFR